MRTSSLAFMLASLLLVGLGCKEPSVSRGPDGTLFLGAHEASDTIERVVALGTRKLILEGHTGNIVLKTTDADVAKLSVTRRARADTPQEAEQKVPGLNIEEEGDEVAFRYRFGAGSPETSRFDIVGEIPRATPLLVNWRSGNISVESYADGVEIRTVNGNVEFKGSSPRVALQTRNGDIAAELVSVPRGTAHPSNVELITANGNVSAAIPATADMRVEAETSAGTIHSGGFTYVSKKFSLVGAGARFQARLGEGSGILKLATQHGSVSVDMLEVFAPDETGSAGPTDTTATDAAKPTAIPADTSAAETDRRVPTATHRADTVIARPN